MKKVIDIEKLAQYKTALHYGGQAEAAELAGVSRKAVCCYLKGESDNKDIEIAILKVIAKKKKEIDQLRKEAGFL